MTSCVPIIDLGRLGSGINHGHVAALVDAACRDIGFLLIGGHGVPRSIVDHMHQVSAAFFEQPVHLKQRVEVPDHHELGWRKQGDSYLAETLTPGADEIKAPDWKETFNIGPIRRPADVSNEEAMFFVPNVFPEAPTDFRAVYEDYYRHMEALAATLLRTFAIALDIPEDYFVNKTDRHLGVLAVHHYPAQRKTPQPGQLRAGAHTDFGSITILHTGNNPGGLQVQDRHGVWQDVVADPDHFVVNIGDLLAQWSNDRWVSTLHRVVNPPADRAHLVRQSITFFHQPNWHTVVQCLPHCAGPGNPAKYPPITSGAYLELKLKRLRGLVA